jgi:hypothetical protein
MARSYCRKKYMIFLPHLRPLAALFAMASVLSLATGCGSLDKASNSVAGVLEPYRGHDPAEEAAQAILRLARGENPLSS